MNDLMSFGVHRLWKQFALSLTGLKPGQRALDVAGGTGDLARGHAAPGRQGRAGGAVGHQSAACSRPAATGCSTQATRATSQCLVADAERLPFADDSFDCVTIGFGLRNVTDKAAALRSMHRVLKPGGQLLVLEFSTPVAPGLKPLYDAYSFNVLPLLGRLVARDADSYRYLAESIRMHPDQETLLGMLRARRIRRRRAITTSPAASSPCTAGTRSDMPATPAWLAAVESLLEPQHRRLAARRRTARAA